MPGRAARLAQRMTEKCPSTHIGMLPWSSHWSLRTLPQYGSWLPWRQIGGMRRDFTHTGRTDITELGWLVLARCAPVKREPGDLCKRARGADTRKWPIRQPPLPSWGYRSSLDRWGPGAQEKDKSDSEPINQFSKNIHGLSWYSYNICV